MSKKRSRFKFVFLALIAALGIFLTCFSFRIPFTTTTFKGFAKAIQLGLDVRGGVVAVYEASVDAEYEDELDTRITATISRLEQFLQDANFSEASVTKQGSNKIRVEVPDVDDPQVVFDIIGEPAALSIKRSTTADADAITGEDVASAVAYYQNSQWGVLLKMNDSGISKFQALTTEAYNDASDKTITITVGPEEDPTWQTSPTVQSVISDGTTFISGNESSPFSKETAEEYATKILSGTFSTKLEVVSNSVVSASLGEKALFYSLIAGGIGLLAIFIFMIVVYGMMGLMADFALVFYVVLFAFVLQAVPLVQLTLPGIAGIVLSLGMAVDANVIVFERIKEEYRAGKKIPASIKMGFKNAFSSIFDSNITTIIASVVLYLLGTATIKGFAITLFFGILLSMFTSLVITRSLMKTYLNINSTNAKLYRLKKEGK